MVVSSAQCVLMSYIGENGSKMPPRDQFTPNSADPKTATPTTTNIDVCPLGSKTDLTVEDSASSKESEPHSDDINGSSHDLELNFRSSIIKHVNGEAQLPPIHHLPPKIHSDSISRLAYPKISFESAKLSSWLKLRECTHRLNNLEKTAKSFLLSSGLNFGESVTQQMVSRISRDCNILTSAAKTEDVIDYFVNESTIVKNQPEASSYQGLAGILETLDSDATESDSCESAGSDAESVPDETFEEIHAKWLMFRAGILSQWLYVNQRLVDVEYRMRIYSEIQDRIKAITGCEPSALRSWESCVTDSSARCIVPPAEMTTRKRRKVHVPANALSSSTMCSCLPPLSGCTLCAGWINKASSVIPSLTAQQRFQLLDPAAHKYLSTTRNYEAAVTSIFRKKQQRSKPYSLSSMGQKKSRVKQTDDFDSDSSVSTTLSTYSRRKRRKLVPEKTIRPLPSDLTFSTVDSIPYGDTSQHDSTSFDDDDKDSEATFSVSSAAPKLSLRPRHPSHLSSFSVDSPHLFNGSEDRDTSSSPEYVPTSRPEFNEPKEISTPAWSEVQVQNGMSSEKPVVSFYAKSSMKRDHLRLCFVQETDQMMVEDLSDTTFYLRHRPHEKTEHLKNCGRNLQSPDKGMAYHRTKQHLVALPVQTQGYLPRTFPLEEGVL